MNDKNEATEPATTQAPSDVATPCAKCATPDMCKRLSCADAILIAQEAGEAPDLVARGMAWEECEAMMREACAQAGVAWGEDQKPQDIAINVMQRLANAAHKAGFKLALERIAATAAPGGMTAFDEARDAILNERGPLEGMGLSGDQINAVLAVLDDAASVPSTAAGDLPEDVTNYLKGIYAFLETVAPAGLAAEAFRLPPSPTRTQIALFDTASGYKHSERAGFARQDSIDRSEDRGVVAAQQSTAASVTQGKNCVGAPGECDFNGNCMYSCKPSTAAASAAVEVASELQNSAPRRIYLDIGEQFALERVLSGGLSWQSLEGVTWSEDNATSHGVEYVRADLAAPPAPATAGTAAVERVPSGLKGLDVYLISMASRMGVEDGKQLRQWAQALAQPKAAPAQQGDAPSSLSAEQVQCGWIDEFGNMFPMGAWKPAQRTWHDGHKALWEPVYRITPPAPAAATQQAERPAPAGPAAEADWRAIALQYTPPPDGWMSSNDYTLSRLAALAASHEMQAEKGGEAS